MAEVICKSVSKQGIRCASDEGHSGEHRALKESPISEPRPRPAKRVSGDSLSGWFKAIREIPHTPRPRPVRRWAVRFDNHEEQQPCIVYTDGDCVRYLWLDGEVHEDQPPMARAIVATLNRLDAKLPGRAGR